LTTLAISSMLMQGVSTRGDICAAQPGPDGRHMDKAGTRLQPLVLNEMEHRVHHLVAENFEGKFEACASTLLLRSGVAMVLTGR
jgi:hypothetical protein